MYHFNSSLRTAVLSVCLLLFSLDVYGYDFQAGGIYYDINDDSVSVRVTYQGTYYDVEGWTHIVSDYSGHVSIPPTVSYAGQSYTVVSIGSAAFSNSGVSKVTIPNTVTAISDDAFYGCYNLSSVIIPNSVTEIGRGAFYSCGNLYSITLPQQLKVIRNATFEESGLTSIDIPASVTTIEADAFWGSNLTSIYIPANVTSIGSMAFSFCSYLTSIKVSEDNPVYDSRQDCNAIIQTANNRLLRACDNTFIPNTVTSIGNHAFDCCKKITSVVIPESVTAIGSWAFVYCPNLSQVTCLALTPPQTAMQYSFTDYSTTTLFVIKKVVDAYKSDEYWGRFSNIVGINSTSKFQVDSIWYLLTSENTVKMVNTDDHENTVAYHGNIVIPGTVQFEGTDYHVTSIDDELFKNNTELTGIVIPNTVTQLPMWLFEGCTALTSVTLPSGMTVIGNGAFSGCTALTDIKLPSSLTTLGNYAFEKCKGLTGIDLPHTLKKIGISAFQYCSGLTSLNIPASVSDIQEHAFIGCTGLTSIQVQEGNSKYDSRGNCNAIMERSSSDLILGCVNTIIPENTRWIGPYSFQNCKGLTSITIPKSVTRIAMYAFSGCSDLATVLLPANSDLIEIMQYAFAGCTSLTNFDIPVKVTFVDDHAFYYCTGLKHVSISYNMKVICDHLFQNCSSLTLVMLPASIQRIDEYAFANCSSLTTVICQGETPPRMMSSSCFSNYDKMTLYVPHNAVGTYHDTNYWWKFSSILGGYPSLDPCDVNGDYKIDIADINATIDAILGIFYTERADVNRDGEVNISDINTIINTIFAQ